MKTAATPAIETLRSMYRSVRAGAELDARSFATTLALAVAEGADTFKVLRAFEPLAFIRLDFVEGSDGVALVRAARDHGGWLAALRVCSLLGWTQEWALAMTAHFGPTGIHESRLGSDGRPTAETLAAFPHIAERMAEAAERFDSYLARREINDGSTRWEYVLQMRNAA